MTEMRIERRRIKRDLLYFSIDIIAAQNRKGKKIRIPTIAVTNGRITRSVIKSSYVRSGIVRIPIMMYRQNTNEISKPEMAKIFG